MYVFAYACLCEHVQVNLCVYVCLFSVYVCERPLTGHRNRIAVTVTKKSTSLKGQTLVSQGLDRL